MIPEDFYTKPACNTPQRLPLFTPDGKDSGEWIEVYGIDSDAYDAVRAETQRQLMSVDMSMSLAKEKALSADNSPEAFDRSIAELSRVSEDRRQIISDRELETKAALVAGWSFEKEFTQDNVKEFLRNAPTIALELDRFVSNRMNFIKKK
ncbi:phage tail assembly chaperone [Endozoicomonas sp. ONNA1]|uniref:phage tail assembly chaperone n=1 Tax=Endozoicomonas sp. ONNA1 TaxID=2828740 RepID=UPI002147DFDC|nr:phage tail assembly chaperone [Endozoicomonas sp. ONNA1]